MSVSNYTLARLAEATSVNENEPRYVPSAASKKAEKYATAINGCGVSAIVGMIIVFAGMTILEFTHARACFIPMAIGGGLFALSFAGAAGCYYKVMFKKLSHQEVLDFIGLNGQTAIGDFNSQIDEYAASEQGKCTDFEATKVAYASRIALVWQDLFRSSVTTEKQLENFL